jgi:hypothetical protein
MQLFVSIFFKQISFPTGHGDRIEFAGKNKLLTTISAKLVLLINRRVIMSLKTIKPKKSTRRGFVKEISAGAAGMAVAGALSAAMVPSGGGLMAAPGSMVSEPPPGESKYRKYFTSELRPEELEIGYGALKNMFTVFCDGDIIEGCHFFSVMFMGEAATKIAGHGPHKHRDAEVIVALGTDPDHPEDLGAEFELVMGPEMEKHVVNKPSLVFIPGGLIHCPFRVTKVTQPFIFMDMQYSPKSVEVPLRDLVPAEMRDKYIFINSDGSSDKNRSKK